MENVLISNKERLNELKSKFKEEGVEKIHVISDFDRTLTKAFVNGKKTHSLISILRDGNYLTKDYAKKAHALFDKYHPIEIDTKISLEEKRKSMEEWWRTHFKLLIKSGLNRTDLKKVVDSGKIKFRNYLFDFLDILNKHKIPLIIFSSVGLGGEPLSMLFEKENKLTNNIHIVSNSYRWDKDGNAVSVKEPIIHILNKSAIVIHRFPFFNEIKDRKNVILLGDGLGDLGMIEGFEYDNLIKIGFLNENIEENLEIYKKNFDVVILNDSDMNFVNKLIKEII